VREDLLYVGRGLESAMQAGFGSDEGMATAGDFQKIAPAGSRMFVVPVLD
jgi:hypothetical protein